MLRLMESRLGEFGDRFHFGQKGEVFLQIKWMTKSISMTMPQLQSSLWEKKLLTKFQLAEIVSDIANSIKTEIVSRLVKEKLNYFRFHYFHCDSHYFQMLDKVEFENREIEAKIVVVEMMRIKGVIAHFRMKKKNSNDTKGNSKELIGIAVAE